MHRALNLIQYFIISECIAPERRAEVVNSLTGPMLTTARRAQQIAAQDPDEPPMPSWWDDDEDASQSSVAAGMQLGAGV